MASQTFNATSVEHNVSGGTNANWISFNTNGFRTEYNMSSGTTTTSAVYFGSIDSNIINNITSAKLTATVTASGSTSSISKVVIKTFTGTTIKSISNGIVDVDVKNYIKNSVNNGKFGFDFAITLGGFGTYLVIDSAKLVIEYTDTSGGSGGSGGGSNSGNENTPGVTQEITLKIRPYTATSSNSWLNPEYTYDADETTAGSVSVLKSNYTTKTLNLAFPSLVSELEKAFPDIELDQVKEIKAVDFCMLGKCASSNGAKYTGPKVSFEGASDVINKQKSYTEITKEQASVKNAVNVVLDKFCNEGTTGTIQIYSASTYTSYTFEVYDVYLEVVLGVDTSKKLLRFNKNQIMEIAIGDTNIEKVYLGDTLVFNYVKPEVPEEDDNSFVFIRNKVMENTMHHGGLFSNTGTTNNYVTYTENTGITFNANVANRYAYASFNNQLTAVASYTTAIIKIHNDSTTNRTAKVGVFQSRRAIHNLSSSAPSTIIIDSGNLSFTGGETKTVELSLANFSSDAYNFGAYVIVPSGGTTGKFTITDLYLVKSAGGSSGSGSSNIKTLTLGDFYWYSGGKQTGSGYISTEKLNVSDFFSSGNKTITVTLTKISSVDSAAIDDVKPYIDLWDTDGYDSCLYVKNFVTVYTDTNSLSYTISINELTDYAWDYYPYFAIGFETDYSTTYYASLTVTINN